MRVKVWEYIDKRNPDAGYLGEGEFLGCVPMTEVHTEEEYKQRKKDWLRKVLRAIGMPYEGLLFEQNFEKHWKRAMVAIPYEKQTTPKIKLDSGKIVYGCQIWWKEIESQEAV